MIFYRTCLLEKTKLLKKVYLNFITNLIRDFIEKETPKPAQEPESATQNNNAKRKLSDQKFKTPNKRKMSSGSSSISSISEQDDDNDNEFNELWSDIKIKTSNSDGKSKYF